MLSFITINPSSHRENCFDLEDKINSRWQVDFYTLIDDMDGEPDYQVGTLHFTAYDLETEDPATVYEYLQEKVQLLVDCYLVDQKYSSNPCDPFFGAAYEDVLDQQLKGCLTFFNKIYNKNHTFDASNINYLTRLVYIYYSSLKWLYYGFDGNEKCFEDLEDFNNFKTGKVPLIKQPPYSFY
jgi:hypothetical protein